VAASAKKVMGGHCTVAKIAKHHCPVSQVMAKEPEIAKMVELQLAQPALVSANAPHGILADIVKLTSVPCVVLDKNA